MKKMNKKIAAALMVIATGSVFYGTSPADAKEKTKLDNIEIIFRSHHRDRYWQPSPPPPPPPPPYHHHHRGPRDFEYYGHRGPHMPPPPPHHHHYGPGPGPRDFGPHGPHGRPGPHTPPPPPHRH